MGINFGLTGVMSRSVGLKRDLRLSLLETYANYYYLNFRSYTGVHGDCYDRFLIRMNEMCESVNIINQIVLKLSKYSKMNKNQTTNYTSIQPHLISNYLTLSN